MEQEDTKAEKEIAPPSLKKSKPPPIVSPSVKSDLARPKSSGSMSLTIKIPPSTPEVPKVHPLEALYKRPAGAEGSAAEPPAESKGFSFFGGADDDLEEEEPSRSQVPMTPYTRQDFESRGIRSAAPTPDTAHPNRRFKPWEQEEEDIAEDGDEDDNNAPEDAEDEDEDEDAGDAGAQAGGANGEPTSDFQKWFWENRGDINRSWRKRRKTAGKEKRYRENKARMARAI